MGFRSECVIIRCYTGENRYRERSAAFSVSRPARCSVNSGWKRMRLTRFHPEVRGLEQPRKHIFILYRFYRNENNAVMTPSGEPVMVHLRHLPVLWIVPMKGGGIRRRFFAPFTLKQDRFNYRE